MKKYNIIYANPPWTYKVWSEETGNGRSAASHYNIMSKEEIQQLPVQSICEDNAVLFLWVTAPCLLEGIELIEKWGFKYKTVGFTWVKRNKISDSYFWGMGYYTRANAEYCLLATKGKPLPRISKSVHSVLDDRIMRHSEKPESARTKIVELFGDLPRIELFARTETPGWAVFGNDVTNSIVL